MPLSYPEISVRWGKMEEKDTNPFTPKEGKARKEVVLHRQCDTGCNWTEFCAKDIKGSDQESGRFVEKAGWGKSEICWDYRLHESKEWMIAWQGWLDGLEWPSWIKSIRPLFCQWCGTIEDSEQGIKWSDLSKSGILTTGWLKWGDVSI